MDWHGLYERASRPFRSEGAAFRLVLLTAGVAAVVIAVALLIQLATS